jgi:hypothetical protein
MSAYERAGRVFKVRLDVELPSEALERIERAIQRAVLAELAETDVANGYSVLMRAPADEGAADAGAAGGAGGGAGGPFGREGSETGLPDPLGDLVVDGIWIREERGML